LLDQEMELRLQTVEHRRAMQQLRARSSQDLGASRALIARVQATMERYERLQAGMSEVDSAAAELLQHARKLMDGIDDGSMLAMVAGRRRPSA